MSKQTGAKLTEKLNKTNEKETKKMKKLTINPQFKGAIKLIFVLAVLGAAFYVGTQYQEQYHKQVTTEAVQIVAQLKEPAQQK